MTALSMGVRRPTPANLLFLLLDLAGLMAFLFPFRAPDQPLAPQNRTALLLFSAAAGRLLLAAMAEAQEGLTVHTVALLGALVEWNTHSGSSTQSCLCPAASRPSSC